MSQDFDFIMVAIPCLASTVLLVKVTCLDGISAIAIPYGRSDHLLKHLRCLI